MAPRHKIEELTVWKQEQLIKDRLNGRSYDDIGKELGIAGNSVKRWWLNAVPEDRKLLIAAKQKQEDVQLAADIKAHMPKSAAGDAAPALTHKDAQNSAVVGPSRPCQGAASDMA